MELLPSDRPVAREVPDSVPRHLYAHVLARVPDPRYRVPVRDYTGALAAQIKMQ